MSKISNNKIVLSSILFFLLFALLIFAMDLNLKLPYLENERMLITQGYDTGTHKGLDKYALDFTQNRCDAYGKPVLAATSGKVDLVVFETEKEGKLCGNGVKLDYGNNIASLYCHLSKIEIGIDQIGQPITQGNLIGYVGNSGYVIGEACKDYPGTHLHFAMREEQKKEDGTTIRLAYKPEPMSGYTNFVAGKWYKSDNKLVAKPKEVVKEGPSIPEEISFPQKIKDIPQNISEGISNFFEEKKEQVENAIERQIEKTKKKVEKKVEEVALETQKRIEREIEKQVEKQVKEFEKEMERACAIKTVYGESPELIVLRDFRDKFLLKNNLGKRFVNFYYYHFSPPIAQFLSDKVFLKGVTREVISEPIVYTMRVTQMVWDKN